MRLHPIHVICRRRSAPKHADGKADASDLVFQAYDAKLPTGEHRHPDSQTVPDMDNDTDMLVWMEDQLGIVPAPWELHLGDSPAQAAQLLTRPPLHGQASAAAIPTRSTVSCSNLTTSNSANVLA